MKDKEDLKQMAIECGECEQLMEWTADDPEETMSGVLTPEGIIDTQGITWKCPSCFKEVITWERKGDSPTPGAEGV